MKQLRLNLSTVCETSTMPRCSDDSRPACELKEVLLDARQQGRLTCGIYESGKLLEMSPDDVMLCVLPDNVTNDVTLHIHLTLIEAFCWENDIRIIKVDNVNKLVNLVGCEAGVEETDRVNNAVASSDADCNCVLVEYPTGKCSPAEESILEFHRMTCHLTPQPIIELQV